MITRNIDANSLQEYYDKLCAIQSKRHGSDYLLVHNEIRELLKGCKSYTEFGIMQGTTLAVALLCNPDKVRAYDTRLKLYNKNKHLFEEYTKENNIDYSVFQENSLKCEIEPTDLLYIDTLHVYEQLSQELNIHGKKVKKYIICHDTSAKPELKRAIKEYVRNKNDWEISKVCDKNVGFMTLMRK